MNEGIIEKLNLICNTHGGIEPAKTESSFQGFVKLFTGPNPIIDDKAPNLIGGTIETFTLCGLIDNNFVVRTAGSIYSHE